MRAKASAPQNLAWSTGSAIGAVAAGAGPPVVAGSAAK